MSKNTIKNQQILKSLDTCEELTLPGSEDQLLGTGSAFI